MDVVVGQVLKIQDVCCFCHFGRKKSELGLVDKCKAKCRVLERWVHSDGLYVCDVCDGDDNAIVVIIVKNGVGDG